MLERWFEMSPGKPTDPVFPGIAWDKLAPIFRDHCEAVGIDRARLFEKRANKLRLRAHDMRAFFVTAAMYAGKDALWITDRTGHTSLGMLRTYERDVRRWRELGESPVDVAEAIPEFAARSVAEVAAPVDKPGPPIAVAMRKCTGRELNPYALRRRNLKTEEHDALGKIVDDSAPSESEIAQDKARSDRVLPRCAARWEPDPVEVALAKALTDASAAERFEIVILLVKELEARRVARLTTA